MSVGIHRRISRMARALVSWGLVLGTVVAAVGVAPGAAVAQEQKVEQMVEEASGKYDMLEIGAAEKKLEQAIDFAEQKGVSGTPLARAHMMLGVVRYGAEKDKQVALTAFKDAVAEDPNIELPDVYETPTLKKLMEEARSSVDTSPEPSARADGSGSSAREVDEFTHEPPASATAGEPLTIEAFVPTDMSVAAVYVKFQRYDQDTTWQRVDLEAKNATKFAADIEGRRIYTSQMAYYVQAVDDSGGVVARSGSAREPHAVTVLGSSDFDPRKAKGDDTSGGTTPKDGETDDEMAGGPGDDTDDPEPGPTDEGSGSDDGDPPVAYFDLGGGTAAGFLPGGQPTANPDHDVSAGLAPAFGHARFGAGAFLSERASLGLYMRWQFSPTQDFDAILARNDGGSYSGFADGECLGTGLPGDCLLGVKYRWFFTNTPDLGLYSSFGAGVGRVRHWLRLKENAEAQFCADKPTYRQAGGQEYCYRRDTVRPGWVHFGVGGGVTYEINDVFALMGEAYMQVLFPDAAINLDVNVGPQFRF